MFFFITSAFHYRKINEKVELDANPILKGKNARNLYFKSYKAIMLVNDKKLFLPFSLHGGLLDWHIVPFM